MQGVTEDDVCVLCKREVETCKHLFFNCSFSKHVWYWIRTMMGDPITQRNLHTSLSDAIAYINQNFIANNIKKDIIIAALSSSIWFIWKSRNSIIFNNEKTDRITVCNIIKSNVRDLIINRSRFLKHSRNNPEEIIERWEIIPLRLVNNITSIPNPKSSNIASSSRYMIDGEDDEAESSRSSRRTDSFNINVEREEYLPRRIYEPP